MKRLPQIVLVAITVLIGFTSCTKQFRKARHLERADRYFKNGEYDQAKIEYLNVLRLEPTNAHAYSQIGAMWLEENVPLRGGYFLLKGKELAPHDLPNRLRLARVYTLIGNMPTAREEAQSILKESPSNGEALLLLAQASINKKDVADAEEMAKNFSPQNSPYVAFALAVCATRRGDVAGAQSYLDQTILLAPNLAEAHQIKGLLLLAQGQDGSEELKKAAELAPVRSIERLGFAEFQLQKGKTEEGKAYLRKLTEQARDFVAAWGLQAKAALSEKKFDEATKALENVFSRDPDNLEGRLLEAQILLEKGEMAKARDTLEHLDRSRPDIPSVKNALAIAELQSGNPNGAITNLEEAIKLNPNYADAILLLAELRVRTGNSAAAIDLLVKLLQRQPQLARAQVILADAYLNTGKFDEAAALFQRQIEANPNSSRPYLLLGVVLEKQKKLTEARKAFERAVELDGHNVQAIDQLVNLDLLDQAYDAAQKRVTQLLQGQPQLAVAYVMQGRIELAQKKTEAAITSLKKALELNSDLAAPYQLLVGIYLSQNKLPDALRELATVSEKSPKDIRPVLTSAMIYERMNDAEKARDNYEKALAINPNSTQTLNNLAYLYSEKLNNLNRASELARKAHTLAPSEGSVSDTFGWITYKQGDYQGAVESLQQAATKLADNGEIQFHLGMAYYMMGRQPEAKEALEKAVSLPGAGGWKEEAKKRLAAIANPAALAASAVELEKSLAGRPNDPVALVSLGAAYEKEGALEKAADAYERALRANPKLIEAALKLAQLNAGPLKNKEKALEYAKKARDLAPGDPKVTAIVGHLAYATGNFPWSYSLLQEAARQLPDDSDVAHDLAWAAFAMGKLDEAERAMQRVGAGTAASADAKQFLLFLPYVREHKDAGTISGELEQSLAVDPSYAPALMLRGDASGRRGDMAAATADYENVLTRYPDFAPAQKRLAAIYVEDSQSLMKAQDLANKARRTLGQDPEIDRILGIIAFQRKEYSRAVQLLQSSGAKQPLDAKANFALGMAASQAGAKKEQASVALKAALAGGLTGEKAEEAKKALAGLEQTKKP